MIKEKTNLERTNSKSAYNRKTNTQLKPKKGPTKKIVSSISKSVLKSNDWKPKSY